MSRVQVIETDGKPAFYVVPADIWLRVREMVLDAEDAAAFTEAVAQDDGFRVPLSVVEAKLGDRLAHRVDRARVVADDLDTPSREVARAIAGRSPRSRYQASAARA